MLRIALILLTLVLLPGCARDANRQIAVKQALADKALAAGDAAGAIGALKDLIDLDPDGVAARWELGQLLLKLDAPGEAESHIRRAMDLGLSPASALPQLARALVEQGKYDEAIAMALNPPASLPSDARSLLDAERALALVLTGRLTEASQAIDFAARGGDSLARVALVQARVLIARNEREEAMGRVREGLARFPSDPGLWALLADLERDTGNGQAADDAYSQAIALSLGPEYLYVLRARLRLDILDLPGAAKDVAILERMAPGSYPTLLLRGRLALQQGKGEDAVAALQSAMRLDRFSFEALFYAGLAAQATGRANEAQDLLQRAVADQPYYLPARYALAFLRLSQGRFAEAESTIRPIVAALPDKEAPLRVLAASLIAQGKSAEAASALERAAGAPTAAAQTRLQLGIALMASGQADRGELVFDRLADMQPSFSATYELILGYYFGKKDMTSVRRWLGRFVKERPQSAAPLVWQARVELAEGKGQAARDTLMRAVALDPKGTAARYALARLALADRQEAAAREQFQAIVSGKADHLAALLGLSALERQAQRPERAQRWLEMAIAAFPTEPGPLIDLAGLHIAAGAPRDALAVLRGHDEERFHTDPGFLRVLGETERLAGESQKATLTFRELTRIEPKAASTWLAYARSLLAVDDRVGALDALARVLALDPKADQARIDYARLLYGAGRYEDADQALAPLRDTNRPEAKMLAGLLAEKQRSPAAALPLLKEAYRLAPSTQTLLVLARVTAHAGDLAEAVRLQQAWLADHPEAIDVRLSLAHDLAAQQAFAAAIGQYREVLARTPDHVVALNNLAWYLRDQDPRSAVAYATHAVELAPDSDAAVDTLAAVYVAIGRPADALRATEVGLVRAPASTTQRLRKARLMLALGQDADAVKLLVDLARSGSDAVQQAEATRVLDEVLASHSKSRPVPPSPPIGVGE